MRYSIPVFFQPRQQEGEKLAWTVESRQGRLVVKATNTGGRRVRISGMKVTDASGASVMFGNGLNGYVLARSSMEWVAPVAAPKLNSTGSVTITATGDTGPINAKALSTTAR